MVLVTTSKICFIIILLLIAIPISKSKQINNLRTSIKVTNEIYDQF